MALVLKHSLNQNSSARSGGYYADTDLERYIWFSDEHQTSNFWGCWEYDTVDDTYVEILDSSDVSELTTPECYNSGLNNTSYFGPVYFEDDLWMVYEDENDTPKSYHVYRGTGTGGGTWTWTRTLQETTNTSFDVGLFVIDDELVFVSVEGSGFTDAELYSRKWNGSSWGSKTASTRTTSYQFIEDDGAGINNIGGQFIFDYKSNAGHQGATVVWSDSGGGTVYSLWIVFEWNGTKFEEKLYEKFVAGAHDSGQDFAADYVGALEYKHWFNQGASPQDGWKDTPLDTSALTTPSTGGSSNGPIKQKGFSPNISCNYGGSQVTLYEWNNSTEDWENQYTVASQNINPTAIWQFTDYTRWYMEPGSTGDLYSESVPSGCFGSYSEDFLSDLGNYDNNLTTVIWYNVTVACARHQPSAPTASHMETNDGAPHITIYPGSTFSGKWLINQNTSPISGSESAIDVIFTWDDTSTTTLSIVDKDGATDATPNGSNWETFNFDLTAYEDKVVTKIAFETQDDTWQYLTYLDDLCLDGGTAPEPSQPGGYTILYWGFNDVTLDNHPIVVDQ